MSATLTQKEREKENHGRPYHVPSPFLTRPCQKAVGKPHETTTFIHPPPPALFHINPLHSQRFSKITIASRCLRSPDFSELPCRLPTPLLPGLTHAAGRRPPPRCSSLNARKIPWAPPFSLPPLPRSRTGPKLAALFRVPRSRRPPFSAPGERRSRPGMRQTEA
jgi:hypothetical protein